MHLPTLIIISLLVNFLIGIYLLILYRRKPRDRCFMYWASSCFIFVLGGIAASLRALDYSAFLTYFVADVLLVSAPVLVLVGLVQFSRFRITREKRQRLKCLLAIVTLTLLIAHPFPLIINIIASCVIAVLFLMCSMLLARSVFDEPFYTSVLRTIFVLHSLIMLLQAAVYLIGDGDFQKAYTPDIMMFLLVSHVLLTTLMALLLPWLSFLKLERKLILKSQRDGLTNLANRTHFFDLAERQWRKNQNTSLIVMMIDIDNFKSVNDNFGHLVGDEVIRRTAKVLSKGLRSHDFIGRIGGEEFAALMVNESLETAEKVAQRLLTQVQNAKVEVNEHILNVTISIGIVQAIPNINSLLKAFDAADKALYDSKHRGRNTITLGKLNTSRSDSQ